MGMPGRHNGSRSAANGASFTFHKNNTAARRLSAASWCWRHFGTSLQTSHESVGFVPQDLGSWRRVTCAATTCHRPARLTHT